MLSVAKLVLVLACAQGLPTSLLSEPFDAKDETIVQIESGLVQGTRVGMILQFLGIPYASPPTNELRFANPTLAKPWEGVLKADKLPPACPQNCTLMKLACPELISEDCLFLNIWTPSQSQRIANARTERKPSFSGFSGDPMRSRPFQDSYIPVDLLQETTNSSKHQELLPVFVFIHGGMFLLSHSGVPILNGSRISEKGAVVVTFNYRLGALGFLSSGNVSGNFGFFDQHFVLQWVKQNIARFGGDPNRVTLGGQSAGAMSVAVHMVSPLSEGLFHRAILQSPLMGLPLLTQEQSSYELGRDFIEKLGCDSAVSTVECLRNASIPDILAAQALDFANLRVVRKLYGSPYFASLILPWAPVISADVVPDQPLNLVRTGKWNKVPVIAGFTKDEVASFVPLIIPELGKYSYEALIYAYFGLRVSSQILSVYPATDGIDQRKVLAEVVRDMFIACPLRMTTQNNSFPAYLYRFDHVMSDGRLWAEYQDLCSHYACHSSELAIVFAGQTAPALTQTDGVLTAEETQGAEDLHNYWARFIVSSDPNGDGAFLWPRSGGNGPYLVVDTPLSLDAQGVNQDRCNLWDSIGYFW
eukprot:c38857_g1_i1.p1 GENE.c38857_g1_i1~~c38857_g1_i1.p1  ORF type:complete len:587 (-),score=76.30 c38857_g1_i1:551-2311(-)